MTTENGPAIDPFRLPRTAVPTHYALTISPDLRKRDFVGQVIVQLDTPEGPVSELVCNAVDLTILKASATGADGSPMDATVALNPEAERVSFLLPRSIVGPAKLSVQFSGNLNEKLTGFYPSTFVGVDGEQRVIAATQFEATSARRAFPCWDEPDFKAVFGITVVVPEGVAAFSNAPIAADTAIANGRRSLRFAETPLMSTYLVCFVVGELAATPAVDVDGVPLRVVCRAGMHHLAPFALEIGAFALRYFRSYYDLPYPAAKLDLIALPDFASGAMENLGAVTFREQLLLIDPATASRSELERVADVVAHEIAHMWFGDLVTMKWWNGLWLNEAFATFMEVACVDAFRPEWKRWEGFALYRSAAQVIDGLHSTRPIEYPVVSPRDAEGMFDLITYEKGASVLRMLEQYLGEEGFREGVRQYLSRHAWGNAETTDLFDAIEEVTKEPVRALMDSWIFQGGYPVTSVGLSGTTMTLEQERFTYLEGGEPRSWQVPILYRLLRSEPGSRYDEARTLLEQTSSTVEVPADTAAAVLNSGGHGFYRVRYSPELLATLRGRAAELGTIERYGLIADTWASVLAGSTAAKEFIDLAAGFASERDPNVWAAITGGLSPLYTILDVVPRAALADRIRALGGPVLEELGWASSPGEPPLLGQLRGQTINLLGTIGADTACQGRALDLFDDSLEDPAAADPDIAAALLGVASFVGGVDRYERILRRMSHASTPQEEQRLLFALGGFSDPALCLRTLDFSLTDNVRSQDGPFLLRQMLGHRLNGAATWRLVVARWTDILSRFPDNSIVRLLDGLASLSLAFPEEAADAEAFFAAGSGHVVPEGELQLAQHLERLAVHRALRARERDRLSAALL